MLEEGNKRLFILHVIMHVINQHACSQEKTPTHTSRSQGAHTQPDRKLFTPDTTGGKGCLCLHTPKLLA